MRRDLAEKPEGPRLVAPLAPLAGQGERSLRRVQRLVELAGKQAGLAELHEADCLVHPQLQGATHGERLAQQREALLESPGQGAGIAKGAVEQRVPEPCFRGGGPGALEEARRGVDVPPNETQRCETPAGHDQAVWMVERLGIADALFAALHAGVERAPLAKGPCQPPAGGRGWKPRKPATLAGERPVEEPDHGAERLLGLTIVTGGMRRAADEVIASEPQRTVVQPIGDRTSAMRDCQCLPGFAGAPEVMAQER